MNLEILICTIGSGIDRVATMLMQQRDDVSYLVSWQVPSLAEVVVPEELRRDDVRVVLLEGRGLSHNRNNALDNARGDICLIADDDLEYSEDSLGKVIECFEMNPQIDIATFCYDSLEDKKEYPNYEFDLSRFPKGYYISSIEIAFRRNSVQGKLRFDEHFGLGSPVLLAGEENVFVHDALTMGLKGRFFPITIVRHNHATTSVRECGERGLVMANAAYLHVAYRHDHMWLRAVLMAWRVSRAGKLPFMKASKWVWEGIAYAKRIGR